MRIAAVVLGAVGTLALVIAIVQSMLITRNSRNVVSVVVSSTVSFLARVPLRLFRHYRGRDRWLSFVAPVTLLAQLVLYVILFIFMLGALVWGTTSLSWSRALYQAGSTFTTLGTVESVNTASAVICLLAAFLGLVIIAIFISYLMSLYSMYSARESVMARIATYAGEPAWGPEVLARSARLGKPLSREPDAQLMLDWVSQMRLNQALNPVLAEFRSINPNRHWLVTLIATLDAVALRLALKKSDDVATDIQYVTEGAITLGLSRGMHDHNWDVERQLLAALSHPGNADASLTNEEWEAGWSEMQRAGVTKGAKESEIRLRFQALRAVYIHHAFPLVSSYHAVRAPWTGERVIRTPVVWPERASHLSTKRTGGHA